ncbi:hypothetical protein NKH77_44200 [Streptomyces sp. M19]
MTTSHVSYLLVTAQGVRVGDVLLSTHVPPRVVRIGVTRNGGRLLILSSGGVHPLRPQDTAYVLRHHRFSE